MIDLFEEISPHKEICLANLVTVYVLVRLFVFICLCACMFVRASLCVGECVYVCVDRERDGVRECLLVCMCISRMHIFISMNVVC